MNKLEKYTGKKTYMFCNGTLATPEAVQEQFPAVNIFTHVIETDLTGEVCFAVMNLSALRSMRGLDLALTDDEAIARLEEIINASPVSTPSAEERIAAALEFQNLMSL